MQVEDEMVTVAILPWRGVMFYLFVDVCKNMFVVSTVNFLVTYHNETS